MSSTFFVKRLEEFRRLFGSDRAIGQKIGVSSQTVCRWRSQRRTKIDVQHLVRLAEATGESVDSLVGHTKVTCGKELLTAGKHGHRTSSDINLTRFQQILDMLASHRGWSQASTKQRLLDAVDIYILLGQNPTNEEILQHYRAIRARRKQHRTSIRNSGRS